MILLFTAYCMDACIAVFTALAIETCLLNHKVIKRKNKPYFLPPDFTHLLIIEFRYVYLIHGNCSSGWSIQTS